MVTRRKKVISLSVIFFSVLLTILFLVGIGNNINTRPKAATAPSNPQEMPVKVLVLVYDPIIESQGGKRVHELYGWNDPIQLSNQLVNDFKTISHGIVNYQIVETLVLDEFPLHTNGQRFTDETYLIERQKHEWAMGSGDYNAIITSNRLAEKVNSGAIDEVFMWGFPEAGWAESVMAGNGAFWINGGPINGVNSKAFVIMGFNYERGMTEALESYGHRTESIIRRVYGSWENTETHDWNKFTMLDRDLAGRGGIGNAHNAFNAEPGTDYNRESSRYTMTTADDWDKFPNLTGQSTSKNCTAWGCNSYGYMKWWYSKMPHVEGLKNGILNNWWRYIADPNQYKSNWKFGSDSENDYAENNVSLWSCDAQQASCTLADDTNQKMIGSSSIKFTTNGAFDTWVKYPAALDANINATGKDYLTFWVYAINTNQFGFQDNPPAVYLRNSNGGYYKYQSSTDQLASARNSWKRIAIPLNGGDGWARTESGTPSLSDIDQIEIHADTWDAGFTLYFDGLGFSSSGFNDSVNPSVAIVPLQNTNVSGTVPVEVGASDNNVIYRVDLMIDGQFIETDALYPYIFNLNTSNLPAGQHTITANAYDLVGNSTSSQAISINVTTSATPTPIITATPASTPTILPTSTPTPIATGDKTPPFVAFTYPTNNLRINRNTTINMAANATDNVGVARVDFYANGSLVCQDTTAPYNCSWKLPGKPNTTYKLKATAVDRSNNVYSTEISIFAMQ